MCFVHLSVIVSLPHGAIGWSVILVFPGQIFMLIQILSIDLDTLFVGPTLEYCSWHLISSLELLLASVT